MSQNDASAPVPSGFLSTEGQTDQQTAVIREDQIQNAVAFLSHPKVRSSPVATKRSFLDKKGLTSAEIDEAFRRVPPEVVEATQGAAANPGVLVSQQGVPAAVLPAQHPGQVAPAPAPAGVRWTQVVLGAGVVAAGVYAIQRYVMPYAYDWFGQVMNGMRREQQQQMLEVKQALESLQHTDTELTGAIRQLAESVKELREHVQHSASQREVLTVNELRQELRVLQSTAADFSSRGGAPPLEVQALQGEVSALKAALKQLTAQQTGGVGSGFRGPGSYPAIGSSNGYPVLPYDEAYVSAPRSLVGAARGREEPRDDAANLSYAEVMEMVSKGITPPNVRKDINDAPPDPTRPASAARLATPRKPWEHGESSSPSFVATASSAYAPWATGPRTVPGATQAMTSSNSRGELTAAAVNGSTDFPPSHRPLLGPVAPSTSVFASVQQGGEDDPAGVAQAPAGAEFAVQASVAAGSDSSSSQALARVSSAPSADALPLLPQAVWRPPGVPAPTVTSAPSSVYAGSDAGGPAPIEP